MPKVPQLGGNHARQSVARQVELQHPAERVGAHAVPVADGALAPPATRVRPIRASRSPVQRIQGRAVRFVAERSFAVVDRPRPLDKVGRSQNAEPGVLLGTVGLQDR